ncbi:hypothetical protein ACMDB5_13120 [Flavobacterium sp. W1B]|uniref:hypothetical protein n=1 Tax=Flavobacterium sp. W1B TaxID=3394146 RepID=UPI0039BD0790
MEIIWIALALGWVSLMLGSSGRSTGMPRYRNPPPPKRKGSVPRMQNPPHPPKLNKNHRDEISRSSK